MCRLLPVASFLFWTAFSGFFPLLTATSLFLHVQTTEKRASGFFPLLTATSLFLHVQTTEKRASGFFPLLIVFSLFLHVQTTKKRASGFFPLLTVFSLLLHVQIAKRGREEAVRGRGGATPRAAQEGPPGLQVPAPPPQAPEGRQPVQRQQQPAAAGRAAEGPRGPGHLLPERRLLQRVLQPARRLQRAAHPARHAQPARAHEYEVSLRPQAGLHAR